MAVKLLLAILLALFSVAAEAKPLTVKPGESWAFRIVKGEPVKAHRVTATAKPAKGEVMVTVRAFLGTMLTAANGTGRGLTFKAELVTGGKASPARTCTLPANNDPILEQWPGKPADAVRLSHFVRARGASC